MRRARAGDPATMSDGSRTRRTRRAAGAGGRTLAAAAAAVALIATVPAAASASGQAGALASPFISSAPVVLSLKPAEGSEAGGTKVKITGEHLKGATTVDFGSTPVTLSKPNKSESAVAVVSPAGTGIVDVTVSTPEATSEAVPADLFSYRSIAPTVTNISPKSGHASSQRKVTIAGSNFTGATEVRFGSISVPFTLTNSKKIKTAAPPAQVVGPVDITVTTPQGTSEATPADRFDFEAEAPSVESVTPEIGPSGETVALEGEGFVGTSEVRFGGVPATSFEVVNDIRIIAVTPPHPTERVAITIATPQGKSPAVCASGKCAPIAHYKFRPTVSAVSPGSGPLAGATPITITGSNFEIGHSRIDIGEREAVEISCSSETTCTAVTPPGKAAGTVPVQVHVPSNYNTKESVSPITEATQFTYE
jgi:IPT/TIG domain-containing protein